MFKPWRTPEIVTVLNRPGRGDSKSHRHKKLNVRFDIAPVEEAQPSTKCREALSFSPIQDFCSSLCVAASRVERQESLGYISNELDASLNYTMHAVKILPKHVPQRPLRDALVRISRRDRLHIAAGLACGVIQYSGNWLKPWWDISDVHLAATSDGSSVLLDDLYLVWPLATISKMQEPRDDGHPNLGDNRLLPLGLALVELSLKKPLRTLLDLEEEDHDILVTNFKTASWLVDEVHKESGTNYADAVHSCLSWSTLYFETRFEERVFDTIISPLLKDLIHFEGSTRYG